MRTDFDTLSDGDRVTLYPRANNPLHLRPVKAIYAGGCFYADGSPPSEGPDYYLGDVLKFNQGFEIDAATTPTSRSTEPPDTSPSDASA